MKVKTGDKCPTGGIWACIKDGKEISLGIGNKVPPCNSCKKESVFKLVRESN